LEVNRLQAQVPANCEVLLIKTVQHPVCGLITRRKYYVSMPGVPFEMMYMMEDKVLPKIKASFNLPFIIHKTILTVGEGESFLAERIADIEDSLPAIY
jgi:nicotinamide-nucleotide amidase